MELKKLKLRVAEAPFQDVGLGRARLDSESMELLEVERGEFVVIEGRRKTVAKVWGSMSEDEGKGIIRIDHILRRNAEVSLGDEVSVYKANVVPAKMVVIALVVQKGHKVKYAGDFGEYVKKVLQRRAVIEGDLIQIPGITLYGGQGIMFKIVKTVPEGIVLITPNTKVEALEEPILEKYELLKKEILLHLSEIVKLLVDILREKEKYSVENRIECINFLEKLISSGWGIDEINQHKETLEKIAKSEENVEIKVKVEMLLEMMESKQGKRENLNVNQIEFRKNMIKLVEKIENIGREINEIRYNLIKLVNSVE